MHFSRLVRVKGLEPSIKNFTKINCLSHWYYFTNLISILFNSGIEIRLVMTKVMTKQIDIISDSIWHQQQLYYQILIFLTTCLPNKITDSTSHWHLPTSNSPCFSSPLQSSTSPNAWSTAVVPASHSSLSQLWFEFRVQSFVLLQQRFDKQLSISSILSNWQKLF